MGAATSGSSRYGSTAVTSASGVAAAAISRSRIPRCAAFPCACYSSTAAASSARRLEDGESMGEKYPCPESLAGRPVGRADHRRRRRVLSIVRCPRFGRRWECLCGVNARFALQVLARIASSCDTRSQRRRDMMAATGRAAGTSGLSRKAWDLRPCTRTQMSKVAWSRVYSALVGDSSVRATLAPRIPSHAAIRTALTCIVRGPHGLACRFVRPLDSQEHRDVTRGNPRA